jgi:hypothetical protein
MSIFPSLELSDAVQVQDKTRFNANKSFGTATITSITVKPGADESAVELIALSDRYLDWQFNVWNGDFDASNNKIDFVEDGNILVAALTPGTYTLATLAIEIKARMEAVGANIYTVVFDKDDKLTISTTVPFDLLPYSGANSEQSALQIFSYFSEDQDDQIFKGLKEYKAERLRWLPKIVTVFADDGADSLSIDKSIKLYSIAGDALFSSDQDLVGQKSDILKWTKAGRNSFLDFHRKAQNEIIDFFRGKGFINTYGDPLRLKNFVKPEDLNQWSVFLTLRLIFDDISDEVDDIHYVEARQFEGREMRLRDRYMRLDNDDDGVADKGEGINLTSGRLFRR